MCAVEGSWQQGDEGGTRGHGGVSACALIPHLLLSEGRVDAGQLGRPKETVQVEVQTVGLPLDHVAGVEDCAWRGVTGVVGVNFVMLECSTIL